MDSRTDYQHYVRQGWPSRQGLKPRSHNGHQHHPLVEPSKVLLPTLHIKLGLMKNFVKALDREVWWCAFLHQKFRRKSMEKIEAGTLPLMMHWILLNSLPVFSLSPSLQTFLTTTEISSIIFGWWINGEFLPSWCTHVSKSISSGLTWTIFQRIVETSVKNRVSTLTKISAIWRKAIKADWMSVLWPATAGAWRVMWSLLNTNGSPWRDYSFVSSFLSLLYSSCYLFKIFCKSFWINQSNIFNIVFHLPTNTSKFRIFSMC